MCRFDARRRRLVAAALLVAMTAGCTYKLPQPVPLGATASGSTTAGGVKPVRDASVEPDAATTLTSSEPVPQADAAPVLTGPVPTDSTSQTPVDAAPGVEDAHVCLFAGTTCEPGTCPATETCGCDADCNLPNASSECYLGACRVITCSAGHVDCDTDAHNGCEVSVDLDPNPGGIQAVRRLAFTGEIADLTPADWDGHLSYAIQEPCSGCALFPVYNVVPLNPIGNAGRVPDPEDVSAYVKLGWNERGFWLRVLVLDDQWVLAAERATQPVPDVQVAVEDPRNFDNIELYWDAPGPLQFPEHTDHGLFISADGQRSEHLLEMQHTGDVHLKTTQLTPTCRVIEAQLTPEFLLGPSSGPLELASGQHYGFNIGVNDFDRALGEDGSLLLQRQDQLFQLPGMSVTDDQDPYYVGTTLESRDIALSD